MEEEVFEEEVEVVATGKSKRPKATAVSSKPKAQKKPEKKEPTPPPAPVEELKPVEKAAPTEVKQPEKPKEEPILFNPPVVEKTAVAPVARYQEEEDEDEESMINLEDDIEFALPDGDKDARAKGSVMQLSSQIV